MDDHAKGAFDYLESSPYAQIAYTFDLVILAVNARHSRLTGLSAAEQIGRPLFEVYPANPDRPDADAEAPLRRSVERVRSTGEVDIMPVVAHDVEDRERPGHFIERYWQITHSPLVGPGGATCGVLQTTQDVTAEEGIRHDERVRRRSAEAAGQLMFWEVEFGTGAAKLSPGVMELFGFTKAQAQAQERDRSLPPLLDHIHEEDRDAVAANMLAARDAPAGSTFSSEYRVVRPDGTIRHVSASSEVVGRGKGRKQMGVMVDTTAIHRREARLRRMIAEKQALLADVNHRVKNSLQLVSSLLRIEERAATDEAVRSQLQLTEGRVAAIAAIHASLYHHADVSRVNVSEHLRTFCGQLAENHRNALVLRVEDEPLHLPAERAVPFALIINELVADALADHHPGDGPVEISLEYVGPRLLLRVANGVKSPANRPGSLGTRLFDALLGQLGGTFRQDPTHDRYACIEFERA